MLPSYLQFHTTGAKTPDAQMIVCGDIRFSVLTSRLIRIEQKPFTDSATLTSICRSFASPKFTKVIDRNLCLIETEHLTLTYQVGQPLSGDSLKIRLKSKPYTEWHYGDSPLQNLGGTICTLDQINGETRIDDGICSIDGYALLDDSNKPLFTKEGWFEKRPANCLDFYFFGYGHDYEACVKDYYRLTGAPEMLPSYALGNWWSRYFKYTEESYLKLMDRFQEEDIPISVGIIDMDWHETDSDGRQYVEDGWTGYTWNRELFPDPARFLSKLKERNIKTALNLHPAAGVRDWEADYQAMAVAMGIDPSTGDTVPFDNINPDFWKAYFEILHFPKEKDGVNFWWVDWQQGKDYAWIHVFDDTPRDLECMDPLWMLNHMHYLASKRDGKRGLFFSRYAGFGSQRYPIGFSGDTIISWESLRFQPYFTVTASNIGYSFWSHDLGGHMQGYRDDELNVRWIQFGVFSPIFRIHSSNSPFTIREPWAFNPRAEAVLRNFMKMRQELFPYLYTMCYRNYQELIPTIRPIYHTHPECKEAYQVPNEYWFGSELIAAPITEKADSVAERAHTQVWLPEGSWVDWFTGFTYQGGEKLDIYRPLEQMPLFCKAGAIVPMQEHIPHDNHLGKAEKLHIVLAAGSSNTFTLYEDDGETQNYRDGNFCQTPMQMQWSDCCASFTVSPANGNTSLIPETRDYLLELKGFSSGTQCFINGIEVSSSETSTHSLFVPVPNVSTSQGFILTLKNEHGLSSKNEFYRDLVNDVLMRSNCDNSLKGTWNWIIEEKEKSGYMTAVQFVGAPGNNLPGSLFEFLHQIFRVNVPVPTPGLPKPNRRK